MKELELEFEKAYNSALRSLSLSAQLEKKLYQKLIKKGYTKDTVKKVINRLNTNGLLDDTTNLSNYIKELINRKLYGKNIVLKKIMEKGYNSRDYEHDIMREYEKSGGEGEICRKFIEKNNNYFQEYKDNPMKIKSKLINKGFSFDIINKLIKNKEYFE